MTDTLPRRHQTVPQPHHRMLPCHPPSLPPEARKIKAFPPGRDFPAIPALT